MVWKRRLCASWFQCDHRDPGSLGWDQKRQEFRCLICGRRFYDESERRWLFLSMVAVALGFLACQAMIVFEWLR